MQRVGIKLPRGCAEDLILRHTLQVHNYTFGVSIILFVYSNGFLRT